jgi:hypothetical protein
MIWRQNDEDKKQCLRFFVRILRATGYETFSRYANGVRVINGSLSFAPTPMALGLNVEMSHS